MWPLITSIFQYAAATTTILLLFSSLDLVATLNESGPRITVIPKSATVNLYSSVSFTCNYSEPFDYLRWSLSPNNSEPVKLGFCHYSSGKCAAEHSGVYLTFFGGRISVFNVTRQFSTTFVCEIIRGTNAYTASQRLIVLTKPQPPVIIASSTVIQADSNVTLTCYSPGGVPEPSFVWYANIGGQSVALKDESRLDDGNSSVVVVKMRSTDNKLSVGCQVRHLLGDQTTDNMVMLTVLYKPHIRMHSEWRVIDGKSVTVECVAVGNPVPKVMISRNNITLSNGPSVFLAQVTKANAGVYKCSATNSEGTASDSLHLSVLYPVSVEVQSTASVPEGATLQVACKIDASPPPVSVVWRNVTSGAVYSANQSILTIPNVRRSDSGLWRCEATNIMNPNTGSALVSQDFRSTQVYVLYKPDKPTIFARILNAVKGQTVHLTCLSNSNNPGYPEPQFNWSTPLGPRSQLEQLILTNVDQKMDGLYSCIAWNMIGYTSSNEIHLNVQQPPEIIDLPKSVSVALHQTHFELNCTVLAKPKASIVWKKNGVLLDDSDKYSSVSRTLSIKNGFSSALMFYGKLRLSLTKDDDGNYSCEAANIHGKAVRSVTVSVQYQPVINTTIVKVARQSDQTARLYCPVLASPLPTILWNSLGLNVTGDVYSDSHRSYLYHAWLTKVDQYGDFHCVAKNSLGTAVHRFSVVPRSKPDPPVNVKVSSAGWNYLFVTWQPSFDGGYPTSYWLTISGVEIEGKFRRETHHSLSGHSYNISRLFPNTNYTIYVYGINSRGQSEFSKSLFALTGHLDIPQADSDNFISSNFCTKIEKSVDQGRTWSVVKLCADALTDKPEVEKDVLFRMSYCLRYRTNICGPTLLIDKISGLPEVTTSTIIAVAVICGTLIISLLLVLIYFCIKRCTSKRTSKKSQNSNSSGRSLDPIMNATVFTDLCPNSDDSRDVTTSTVQHPRASIISNHSTFMKVREDSLRVNGSLSGRPHGGNMTPRSNMSTPEPHGNNNEYDESKRAFLPSTSFNNTRKVLYEVVV